MTRPGYFVPVDRFGINKSYDNSVWSRASFEKTPDTLFEAAIFGETDHMNGVSANVMFGQPVKVGTGVVDLVTKEPPVPKPTHTPRDWTPGAWKVDFRGDPIRLAPTNKKTTRVHWGDDEALGVAVCAVIRRQRHRLCSNHTTTSATTPHRFTLYAHRSPLYTHTTPTHSSLFAPHSAHHTIHTTDPYCRQLQPNSSRSITEHTVTFRNPTEHTRHAATPVHLRPFFIGHNHRHHSAPPVGHNNTTQTRRGHVVGEPPDTKR